MHYNLKYKKNHSYQADSQTTWTCGSSPFWNYLFNPDREQNFGVTMSSAKKQKVEHYYIWQNAQIFKKYEQLWKSKHLSDVVISCSGGEKIQTHKFILQMFSPVFHAMLESGLMESITNEIKIPRFSKKTLEAMLGFMYTGGVEPIEDLKDMKRILQAANKYRIEELKEAIFKSLVNHMTISTVGKIIKLASKYDAENRFKASIQQFLLRNRSELGKDEEFRKVIAKHGAMVAEIHFGNF